VKKKSKIFLIGSAIAAGATVLFPKLRGNSKKELDRLDMKFIEKSDPIENVRGKPYCEIFTAYRNFNKYKIGIYNNLKRKQISLSDWNNLDIEKLKNELGAAAIIKNGPRFWVMDGIKGYYAGEMREFNGHEFDLVATIERKVSENLDRKYYSEQKIGRYTDWIYLKNEKVFELINDKDEVYTMQAASLEIIPDLALNNIESHLSKLNLPAGWTLRTRTLDDNVTFETRGEATIIQDEYRNTYQKNAVKN
jgi:hypothetical protein